jgi:RNA polymerase sigma factor (sigma-70 family)
LSDRGDPEADLLQRFLKGEREACLLCERWAAEVVHSQSSGIPPADRADLTQETLRQTWQMVSEPDFTAHHSLRALVRRIAVNRCLDWVRRRRVLVEVQESLAHEFPDPVERLEKERRLVRLQRALSELKPFCRDLIRQHFHERRTYLEIAEATGRHPATLRVHMFHCLKSLRSLMEICDH